MRDVHDSCCVDHLIGNANDSIGRTWKLAKLHWSNNLTVHFRMTSDLGRAIMAIAPGMYLHESYNLRRGVIKLVFTVQESYGLGQE